MFFFCRGSGDGGFDEIESEMSPLQIYALRFLENVNPVTEQDQVDALRAQLDTKYGTKEKDWEFCNNGNNSSSDDDDDNGNSGDDDNNNNNNNDSE